MGKYTHKTLNGRWDSWGFKGWYEVTWVPQKHRHTVYPEIAILLGQMKFPSIGWNRGNQNFESEKIGANPSYLGC